MSGIKAVVRKIILDDMVRACNSQGGGGGGNKEAKWKIMILDRTALKITNAVVRQSELTDENITLIEALEKRRAPYDSMEAIYFVSPTLESVNRIIEDFTPSAKNNKTGHLYAAAHLFFTSALDDRLLHKLQSCTTLRPYVKTVKELFLDYLVLESAVFICERPWSLLTFFGTEVSNEQQNKEFHSIAKQIASFCISLNEFPFIRYSSIPQQQQTIGFDRITSKLAALVYEQLEQYADDDDQYPSKDPAYLGKGRSQLIILDRSFDVTSPIIHEFTYQAMANDLLQLTDNGTRYKYRQDDGKDKEVLLDENADQLWAQIRHSHIAECIDIIVGQFNKFLSENKAAKGSGGKANNLKDLKEMMSAIPQFQELKSKFGLHMAMAQECLALFNRYKLEEIAAVEQDLATGETADGGAVKNVEIALTTVMNEPSIQMYDKVRLLMLYVIGKDGLKDDDRRKIFDHAQIPSEMINAIINLSLLGVKLSRPQNTRSGFFGGSNSSSKKPTNPLLLQQNKKKDRKKNDDLPYDLSRYQPLLRAVVESTVEGTLQKEFFPFVREPTFAGAYGAKNLGAAAATGGTNNHLSPHSSGPQHQSSQMSVGSTQATSLRTTKPSWHKKSPSIDASATGGSVPTSPQQQQAVDDKQKGGRIILFIVGGVTYSEIRAIYQISNLIKREIFIGSTHVVTPDQFVDDLKQLKMPVNIPTASSIGNLHSGSGGSGDVSKSKSSLSSQGKEHSKGGLKSMFKGLKMKSSSKKSDK
ncbi:hypothetical protein MIR68_005075 [Amoeboaphelidium protococcarum]|nr:hypothetical protein MIR68_005075 [Amoeboaphelidium protococcarum]